MYSLYYVKWIGAPILRVTKIVTFLKRDNAKMATVPTPADQPPRPGGGKVGRKWSIWSKSEKLQCIRLLHLRCNDGVLARGSLKAVSGQLGVSFTRVSRLWKIFQNTPAPLLNLTPQKKNARLGLRKHDVVAMKQSIIEVDLRHRKTYRDLSRELGMAVSTVHDYKVRDKVLRRDNSRLKPRLTPQNQVHRMLHACGQVAPNGEEFENHFDSIHIDEKWFFVDQDKQGFLVIVPEDEVLEEDEVPEALQKEENTYRSIKSKNFIPKVMFLAAVARPWGDFDGKIGLWTFTEEKPAQRSSINRPAGTLELKNIKVTKDTYKEMLIENLIPAVRQKWPAERPQPIIQHDNAKPHLVSDDAALNAVLQGEENELSMSMMFQPPNSPDFNVLDLCFFRALQSLTQKKRVRTVQELVQNVEMEWHDYDPTKLNHAFLTYQSVMEEVVKIDGHNDYKIPHMGKDTMERQGTLPVVLTLSDEAKEHYNAFMGNLDN